MIYVLVAGNVAPLLLYIWTSSSKSKCVYIGSHIAILAPEYRVIHTGASSVLVDEHSIEWALNIV